MKNNQTPEQIEANRMLAEIWVKALEKKKRPKYNEPDDISFSEQNDIDLKDEFLKYNS